MTIVNPPNDGLYPELISLYRAIAYSGKIDMNAIIDLCTPGTQGYKNRLRGTLRRWTTLGLFELEEEQVQISKRFIKKQKESIDELTSRLPSVCRALVFEPSNCLPLWGESAGVAADFVRGAAWLLAQNSYNFPTTWENYAEDIHNEQFRKGEKLVENNARWTGLRFWMRYLGFATGDNDSFQIDPTIAIKEELPLIFGNRFDLSANEFIMALAFKLPVLDYGQYRQLVEDELNHTYWRQPEKVHLSISLSLALRRLALDNTIRLEGRADAGTSYRLTDRNYRTWLGFESVSWIGGQS